MDTSLTTCKVYAVLFSKYKNDIEIVLIDTCEMPRTILFREYVTLKNFKSKVLLPYIQNQLLVNMN